MVKLVGTHSFFTLVSCSQSCGAHCLGIRVFWLALFRAGAICYARLSGLCFAQTRSSRLSEDDSNSPPLVSSARLSEGLSFGRDRLA
ncbi:hypothetical protein DEO72_LG7g36 [Vigna unguiculata]|uniref:Uncharacterized protein n=1 Tax=Vigna unguiculata TaxID=3917 RepID=A0A4D6MBI4_VIGUN|nr:hypothetical protein DEO72_LG7g36 [Vigna unguiculata]